MQTHILKGTQYIVTYNLWQLKQFHSYKNATCMKQNWKQFKHANRNTLFKSHANLKFTILSFKDTATWKFNTQISKPLNINGKE